MKTFFLIGTASILLAGLTACGSTAHPVAVAPQPGSQAVPGALSTDTARMARIEAKARQRGVHLQWINPPLKRNPAIAQVQ